MSRTSKFIRNAWASALYQITIMITGFILPRIMLSYYGSEVNGLVSSITQFVNYMTLVEAGLSGATIYALYKPLADNDKKEISRIVVASKHFYTISGWIFVILVSLLSIIYPIFVTSNNFNRLQISILIMIIGVNGALEFFTLGKYRAILTADQKQFIIALSSMLYSILNVTIIAIFAHLGFNIIIARFAAIFAVFLRTFILSYYCKKNYPYLDYSVSPNNEALNKRWDALFLQILGTIHTGAPVILATMLTSLVEVSIYAVYNMVVTGINSVLSIFNSGLGAGFGDLIARGEKENYQRAYQEFEYFYYSMITIIYSVGMVQILPFLSIYTKGINDVNYIQPLLGFLFILNGYLYNIKTPQGMLVISAGLYKETKVQTSIQALISVCAGFVFGKMWGIPGIILGMILSNIYRDIDLLFFIPKYVTGLPYKETLLNIILSFTEGIIIIFIGERIPAFNSGLFGWCIKSIIISFIGLLVIIMFGWIFRKNLLIRISVRINNSFRHHTKNNLQIT